MKQLNIHYATGILCIVVLLALSVTQPQHVLADELSLTTNTPASVTDVGVSDTTTTNVTSVTTTAIENTVSLVTDTGNNTSSDNIGSVSVTTGAITTDTALVNSANTTVISPCCTQKGTIVLSSDNVSGASHPTTTVNHTNVADQKASITNTLQGTVNTGGNTASNNSGTVSITTGSITVKTMIKNGPLNTVLGHSSPPDSEPLSEKSQASITSAQSTAMVNIINTIALMLTTGSNTTNNNRGTVTTETGDIAVLTEIIHNHLNDTNVTSDCACSDKHQENPALPPGEKVTPQQPSPDKSSGGGTGEVASIALGKVLPETGINWLLLAFIGNVMMLFLGMILRLRSGNSPGIAVVV